MPARNQQRLREVKEFPASVVEVQEAQGIVEFIASVFGNIDDGDDIVHPGAFVKTITERARRVKVLDQHRTDSISRVIGIPIEMREVGRDELPEHVLREYPDATGGLYVKAQYLLDTPEGLGAFKRIQSGAVTEYSFAFDIIQSDYSTVTKDEKKRRVRNIREVRLWEVSPVVWGMNPATATVGAKEKDSEEGKGYTADGPEQLLGDKLAAKIHRALINQASNYYEEGYLDGAEYALMNQVANEVLDMLQSRIPEDVRLRPIQNNDVWFWFEGDAPEARKALAALAVPEPEEDEPGGDDAKGETVDEASDAPDEAGPAADEQSPTDERLAAIKAASQEIEGMLGQSPTESEV
jgi:hypothetical protein